MMNNINSEKIPKSELDFYNYLKDSFLTYTGSKLGEEKVIHVPKYESSGISSGKIFAEFWIETAIPLLMDRFNQI